MAVFNTLTANIWFKYLGGVAGGIGNNWNGSPGGNPGYVITNNALDGIDMSGAQIPFVNGNHNTKQPLFLTVQGAAGNITVNMGQFPSFAEDPPPGYFPGWPDAYGNPDSFDAASAQGSATLLNPWSVDFPSTEGLMQSRTGHEIGNFYFEITHNFNTLFAGGIGGGVARANPELNFWLGSPCAFNGADSNGGAAYFGGNLGSGFVAQAGVNGVSLSPPLGPADTGAIFGVAVSVFPGPAALIPVGFQPIALKCFPCDAGLYAKRAMRAFRNSG